MPQIHQKSIRKLLGGDRFDPAHLCAKSAFDLKRHMWCVCGAPKLRLHKDLKKKKFPHFFRGLDIRRPTPSAIMRADD